jgi:hypothetical protein
LKEEATPKCKGLKKERPPMKKEQPQNVGGAKNKDNTKVTLQNKSHEGDPVNKDGT